MREDIKSYCREKGIESESELLRQALIHYIDRDYDNDTLKLSGLKDIRENISHLKDMISIIFSYMNSMHLNLLSYHPEFVDDQIKNAAAVSAQRRIEKFSSFFRDQLRDDPPLFEKLLHKYVTGSLDG